MPTTARQLLHSFLAGASWGGAGYLLGARSFGEPVWAGVLASPLIGVAIGSLAQPAFERTRGMRRAGVALVSLYLGVIFFGGAVGAYDYAAGDTIHRSAVAVVLQDVLAALWGVTFTGFFLGLWPLAYGTHWILEWLVES
jgi:hypothetical protein